MNKTFTTIKNLCFLTFLSLSSISFSQNELAIYNFNGTGSETCTNRIVAPATSPVPNANVTFGDFTISNVACVQTANQFNNDGWNTSSSLDLTEYVEFTMTADNGFVINLDSIYFDIRSSQLNGLFYLRSSLDNYTTNLHFGDIPDAYLTFNKTFNGSHDNLTTITFRFYATDVLAANTTIRLDNVIPYGNTSVSSANVSKIQSQFTASISPNPGNDMVNFNFADIQNHVEIKTISASGQILNSIICDGTNAYSLNTSQLSEGIYFFQIQNKSETVTYRWVKK